MIRVIHKMDLGVGEIGFIFCDKHPLLMSQNSGERSRTLGPSCYNMGLIVGKPVFGDSEKVRLKTV